jgi:hypothetical protein
LAQSARAIGSIFRSLGNGTLVIARFSITPSVEDSAHLRLYATSLSPCHIEPLSIAIAKECGPAFDRTWVSCRAPSCD